MNNSSLKRLALYGSIALTASLGTLLAVRARAAGIPETELMTYTGYLEDGEGEALSGEHSVEVSFWDSEDATSDLCTGSNSADPALQSGRFQVPLPQECADAVKASPNIWVSVKVDGGDLGRTKLGAVPFAIEAGHATSADAATTLAGPLANDLFSAYENLDEEGALDNKEGTDLLTRAQQDARYVLATAAPKITAWATYTPGLTTSTGGAVTGTPINTGRWRRVGDSIEVQLATRFNSDVADANYLLWQLPNGLKPVAPIEDVVVGSAELWNGSTITACVLSVSKSQEFHVDCHGASALRRSEVGLSPKPSYVSLHLTVPVVGWTLTGP